MKKSMLPALLVIFMYATVFAQKPPGTDTTASLITTSIVTPAARPAQSAYPSLTLRALTATGKVLPNVLLLWELTAGGIARQKGKIPHLSIAPQHPLLIHLAARMPPDNEETFLHLQYLVPPSPVHLPPVAHTFSLALTPAAAQSASTGASLIAEEWLPLRPWDGSHATVLPAGELTFTDEDGFFTILSPTLHIRFAKQTGWLQHYEIKGYNLIRDSTDLRPDFHRTDTAESPWQQVTRNPRLQLFSTSTGSEIVIVRTEYTLTETHCHLHISYTINASGDMEIQQFLEADSSEQSPPLPRFSMQWALPPELDSITVYGRYSKSTDDPGRNRAPAEIIRATTGEGRLSESSAVRWWKITGREGVGLQFTADSGLVNMSWEPPPDRMHGALLYIDYPPGPSSAPLPYGSYRYGFKVSASPKLTVRTLVSPAKRF